MTRGAKQRPRVVVPANGELPWERSGSQQQAHEKMHCSRARNWLPSSCIASCGLVAFLGLVRLIPLPMDWMGLEKIKKEFDLVGI
jgi:hypothetical protein